MGESVVAPFLQKAWGSNNLASSHAARQCLRHHEHLRTSGDAGGKASAAGDRGTIGPKWTRTGSRKACVVLKRWWAL